MGNGVSLMEEMTFERGLGKMDRVLTGRTCRGGNFRKYKLHKQALEAGKYKAFWRQAPSSIWLEHWEMNKE